MPQSFFHAGKDCLVVTGFDIDHPIRDKSGLREGGSKEVRPCDAPQDPPPGAGSNSRAEQCGRGTVDRAVAAASHFMQRPERQPAAWEARVHRGDSERKHRFRAPVRAFDPCDLRAQRVYGELGPHNCWCPLKMGAMFLFCSSFNARESR